MELRTLALAAFTLADPSQKVAAVRALAAQAGALACDAAAAFNAPAEPGRPDRPLLIHPRAVPKRSPHTVAGHAALMHSIAHIEFNAINLALDAAWRFSGQPEAYYRDWVRVAGVIEPDAATAAVYDDLYPIYRNLYDHAKPDLHALADFADRGR